MTCIKRRGTLKSIGQITVYLNVTALFINMRILKFKIQLMIAFFAAINHLKGPFRKFVICNWWISLRFVCFCVSRFVAADCNYD